MIRVVLPYHLRTLANVGAEVALEVAGPVTVRSILDSLEAKYPVLCGTIRDRGTLQRRPMLRFYACEEDISHDPVDAPLPAAIRRGRRRCGSWGRSPAGREGCRLDGASSGPEADVRSSCIMP